MFGYMHHEIYKRAPHAEGGQVTVKHTGYRYWWRLFFTFCLETLVRINTSNNHIHTTHIHHTYKDNRLADKSFATNDRVC